MRYEETNRRPEGMSRQEWLANLQKEREEAEALLEEMMESSDFIKEANELNAYEDRNIFMSKLHMLIDKHAIDVVNEKLYDKHGCRFLDLLISEDDGKFRELEICYG